MGILIDKDDKVLVVSPHPDDESIGCGGFLSSFRGHCDVLLATDGYSEELNNAEQSAVRLEEFRMATDYLGVENIIFMHIPEQRIKASFPDFMKIDYSRYKYILVPNRYEDHIDHNQLFRVIRKAVKKERAKSELLEYEVWTTIRKPNIKLDISSVIEEKKNAISMHKSQIKDLDYVEMITGLNAYRGKGHGCDYAEVFYSEKQAQEKQLKQLKKKIKLLLKISK